MLRVINKVEFPTGLTRRETCDWRGRGGFTHNRTDRPRMIVLIIALLLITWPGTESMAETPAQNSGTGVRHYRVVVEDEGIKRSAMETAKGILLLPLAEIAHRLGDEYSMDWDQDLFLFTRSQDGARFRIKLETGEVFANADSLGFLAEAAAIDVDRMLFPLNAVKILTGVHARLDESQGLIELRLDDRLRRMLGFSLFVNREPLPASEPPPQAVGSVLLLPLEPIARALGSKIERDSESDTVRVVRIQDSSAIEINLSSGLTRVNGIIVGVSPNMHHAEPDNLLLPSTAVETLTGSHVEVIPGTDHIHVNLDERLSGRILPSADVLNEARNTPLTLETVDFQFGSDTTNHIETRQRRGEYNTRFRYEVPALPFDEYDSLEPGWIALHYESIHGYEGSVGDYVSRRRELDGIDVNRVRGLSQTRHLENGDLVGVAGAPVEGVKEVGDYSVPRFGGAAAGFRYYDKSGDWEAGLAALQNEDGADRLVASQSG